MAATTETQNVIKPLVWDRRSDSLYVADCPLFGRLRVEQDSELFTVLWSVPGYCDRFIVEDFETAEIAMAAAQSEFEKRMLVFITCS